MIRLMGAVFLAGGIVLAGHSQAQVREYGPGVSDTEIVIGQSAPFSGPASAFAVYSRIEQAYFRAINDKGGINGRRIKFIALDNGYTPAKAIEASRKLVEEEHVLAEVGTLGTPTNLAIQKYLNGKKVPQLLITAGGSKFNDPKANPWTVPFYPAFEAEAAGFVKYALRVRPNARIAVLYENDDYGKDFLRGLKMGLGDAHTNAIVAEASYELTDPTIDSQIITLAGSRADVFMSLTTPKFAAQAIRKAYELNWKPVQFITSGGSSVEAALKPAGLDKSTGVISARYFKDPGDPIWEKDAAVLEYLAFLKKYAPSESPYSDIGETGYINALMAEHVLRQAGDKLIRENLLMQATTLKGVILPILLPGLVLRNSSQDYRAFHGFRLVRFDGKGWMTVEDISVQ
jgi:branched-chain amino acid transport system substrate-binding protein